MKPAVLALTVLVLYGCSASNQTVPRPKVVLTVFAGQSTSDYGIEDMITDVVAQAVPDVELRWELVGWGGQFEEQIRAKFAAGEVPDLIIGKAQDVATYLPSGNLSALSPALTARVQPGAVASVSRDGQLFGLPYNTFYQGVIYNKNLFQRLGLSVPRTPAQMAAVVKTLEANGITPFGSHFVETWYIGNIFMQLAIGEIFGQNAAWGSRFRAGAVSFRHSPELARCLDQVKFIYDHTWDDAAVIDYVEADQRFALGRSAMYLTGSWTLQNVNNMKIHPEFGIFPYPNSTGDSRLIFEPNLTFMKSARSDHPEAVDRVLLAVAESADLASRVVEFTKTSTLLTVPLTVEPLLIQPDIDAYRKQGRMVDASTGNGQLIWAFQTEVAARVGQWLQDKAGRSEVLEWADRNRSLSAP